MCRSRRNTTDSFDEPSRKAEQGDQAPRRRGGLLPQWRLRAKAPRIADDRTERPVDRIAQALQSGVDEQAIAAD